MLKFHFKVVLKNPLREISINPCEFL